MKLSTWLTLPALALLITCGGKGAPPPASAEADEAEGDTAADDLGVTEAVGDQTAGEAAAAPEAEPAEAADAEAGEGTAAGDEAEEDEEPPPSENLEDYMGAAPPTPEYKTVQENMKAFKLCYLDALRANPDLQGTIRVRFTVTKAGKVSKAKAIENALNKQVETCVLKELKKIQFPKRDSNRTVEYPFKFIPAPK